MMAPHGIPRGNFPNKTTSNPTGLNINTEDTVTKMEDIMKYFVWMVAVLSSVLCLKILSNWDFLWSLSKLLIMLYYATSHERSHKKGSYSFLDTFDSYIKSRKPGHVQFIIAETGEETTLVQVDELANQVARWGLSQGIKQMDTVAILLLNTPDYVSLWLGFGKIGASSALLNTNQTGNALIHSCEVALANTENKILIVDVDLKDNIANDIPKIEALGITIHFWSAKTEVTSLKQNIIKLSKDAIDRKHRNQITANDALLFIFTSGTTGMPKACKITQSRFYLSTIPYRVLCDLTATDKIYTVLPLYHSAAGLLGIGAALSSGATMVLRKKFSASAFTTECLKYKITSFQYIGELCRYLIAAPENDKDKLLSTIRTAYGNGMTADVWTKFKKRYNIEHIVEFYGATEGNASLFNNFDKVGALGYVPRMFDRLYPLKIIRTEPDDQTQPLRDVDGHCIECKTGEVGLLISQIYPSRRFDGYSDQKATNAKILRNVFKANDMYFNTGDLLSRDAPGFYYWSDRIGDTFRWKGENVATTEVSAVIAKCVGVKDVTVYGVSVPNCDGKAGMGVIATGTAAVNTTATTTSKTNAVSGTTGGAALQGSDKVDVQAMLSDILKECKAHLAVYQRPLFLRIKARGQTLKTTTTFKHVKTDLVKEGFDPSLMGGDLLFYFSAKSGVYLPLTPEVYAEIMQGKVRF